MHPSMKHVAAVRKQLAIRTIFNILGPLVNPAGACYQLLGAGRPELRPLLAGAVAKLGTKRTFVVSGQDGLGDVTLNGGTNVSEVSGPIGSTQATHEFVWQPEDFGIRQNSLETLRVDGPAASAAIIRGVLAGKRGPARDIVLLNAGAALIVAGKATDPKTAAETAAQAIDNGAAANLLAQLAERSHAAA
jgi:anthranilate phosphoribosyltransferase